MIADLLALLAFIGPFLHICAEYFRAYYSLATTCFYESNDSFNGSVLCHKDVCILTHPGHGPETDSILTTSVMGRQVCMPLLGAPTGITLTLLSGTLLVEGFQVATGVQVQLLPAYVTVAKPHTTLIYQRVGRSVNTSNSTGWAFYVKSKNGDYSALSNPTEVITESEKVLHLV